MRRRAPLTPKRVFLAAHRLPKARRDAFVDTVCRENAALRNHVRELLAASEEPTTFGKPPTEVAEILRRIGETALGTEGASVRRHRSPALAAGTRIAERYGIDSLIGEGSSGRVYRATDDVLKLTVAVKILDLEAGEEIERLRREAATLRWLRVPGVVNLQDDGVDEGRPYIVTDLVVGEPFPGASPEPRGPVSWASLRDTSVALLETLARIHAQGVIHGDLKPSNVLVDSAGVPTVLDVGIASGPSIDLGDTDEESIVEGTPSYMAPERIGGAPASVATDLYAVGVMLHQALAGVVPHHETNRTGLFDRRRLEDARPIRDVAPKTPADAAKMIDALLARDPEGRPASAYDALDLLEHLRYVRPGNPDYPWLGTRALIDQLVQAAKDGRSMDIWGPPGSGKTRTLREAAKEVEALGRRVVWLAPSRLPHGSLCVLDSPSPLHRGTSDDGGRWIMNTLRACLASGTILATSDVDGIDPWSRTLLRSARNAGTIWAASPRQAKTATPVPELSPTDLERLFAGSNRVFHLPEDAATELHARSGGLAGEAVRSVASWVRSGLATYERDRVRVDRRTLDRLSVGLVDVAPTARDFASASGSEHAARAVDLGSHQTAVDRALRLVSSARSVGRYSLAVEACEIGLSSATRTAPAATVDELATSLLELALRAGTPEALDRVVRLCSTCRGRTPTMRAIGVIALSGIRSLNSRGQNVLRDIDAMWEALSERLRASAQSVRVLAARSGSVAEEAAAVAHAAEWARTAACDGAAAMLDGWLGWLRYKECRFDEAAELHQRAAAAASELDSTRALRLTSAAQALIEAGRPHEAFAIAQEAAGGARRLRLSQLEARAEVVARIAAYRSGQVVPQDPELVDAVRAVGVPHLTGELLLTEAGIAWRSGDDATAITFASESRAWFARSRGRHAEMLASAFCRFLSDSHPVDPVLLEESANVLAPGAALQVRAMIALAGDAPADETLATMAALRLRLPEASRDVRRELFAYPELEQLVRRRGEAPPNTP